MSQNVLYIPKNYETYCIPRSFLASQHVLNPTRGLYGKKHDFENEKNVTANVTVVYEDVEEVSD